MLGSQCVTPNANLHPTLSFNVSSILSVVENDPCKFVESIISANHYFLDGDSNLLKTPSRYLNLNNTTLVMLALPNWNVWSVN